MYANLWWNLEEYTTTARIIAEGYNGPSILMRVQKKGSEIQMAGKTDGRDYKLYKNVVGVQKIFHYKTR